MKHLVKMLPLLLLIVFCCPLRVGEMRQWIGSNGKTIEAEVLGLEGDIVKIKLKNGREMNVLISKFAKKDQDIIKQITSTEDPFAESDTVAVRGDKAPFQGSEVVRTVIEIDEQGNGKFRLEKTSELPKDDFEGKKVILTAMPEMPIKIEANGLVKIALDFEKFDEAPLFSGARYTIDQKVGELLLTPPGENAGPHDHCFFGLPHGATKLPMRVLVDTKTFQRDIFDLEWIFHDDKDYRSIASFKVFRNTNNSFKFECRLKNCDKKRAKHGEMQEIVKKTGIRIDNPFEMSFKLSLPEEDLGCPIRFCFGRHLNARPDQKTDRSISGHKRLELTAPLVIDLGLRVEEYGGKRRC